MDGRPPASPARSTSARAARASSRRTGIPRHFHLVCNTCHRSSEFLSSDIEALDRGDRGGAQFRRRRRPSCRSFGTCEECRTGVKTVADRRDDDRARLRARRAAHRDRHRAQRPRVLHARGRHDQGRARPRGVREAGRRRAGASRHAREALRGAASPRIRSSSRGRRSSSSRARRTACSPKAPRSCARASTISRRCSSASGASAARTSSSSDTANGSRTPKASGSSSSSPTKSACTCELLIREYRSLRERLGIAPRAARRPRPRGPPVDRSPHPHDGVRRPLHAGASSSRARAPAGVTVLSVTDHDTVAGATRRRAACVSRRHRVRAGHRDDRGRRRRPTSTCSATSSMRSAPGSQAFLAEQRRPPDRSRPAMIDRLADARHRARRRRDSAGRRSTTGQRRRRPVDRARAGRRRRRAPTQARRSTRWLARGRPAFVPRVGAARRPRSFARIHDAGGIASLAHPGLLARDDWIPPFVEAGLDAIEAYHTDHDEAATVHYLGPGRPLGLAVTGGSDYHGDAVAWRAAARQRVAAAPSTSRRCKSRRRADEPRDRLAAPPTSS